MKKILILLMLLSFGEAFSQKYMDKIAKSSCECFNNVEEMTDKEQVTMQLGLCMLDAAMPYQKQLKKDYDIDLGSGNLENAGEKLGTIIALRMAKECPDALMRLVEVAGEEEEAVEEGPGVFEGTISEVKEETFVRLSAKDESGEDQDFYWLTYVESEDVDPAEGLKSLKGKSVEIMYEPMELFDSERKKYRVYNVITRIEIVD